MTQPDTLQKQIRKHPWLPYIAPFLLFILITEAARWLPPFLSPWLYMIKTLLAILLLWLFRRQYRDEFGTPLSAAQWLAAVCCGLVVLFLWVAGESLLPKVGESTLFSATALGESTAAVTIFISFRLLGSSFVVPVIEELFWRSFLMRYLISKDFRSLPVGSFSWFSFVVTAILFGSEHHRIVAGVLAGLLYGGLLLLQKNLRGVVIAHTITNLGLGIYILITGSWQFW